MFTGLVEVKGALLGKKDQSGGARLRIESPLEPLSIGESIAVDGVCLTVVAVQARGFEADASAETLARTTLGLLRLGSHVNLERALPLGARMGGHIVTGHVDGTIMLRDRQPIGDAVNFTFTLSPKLARYVAEKGSVTINGVSLTVNGATPSQFSVMVIPHTLKHTTLGELVVGEPVNVEVDLLARYIARLIDVGYLSKGSESDDNAWISRLRRAGYIE